MRHMAGCAQQASVLRRYAVTLDASGSALQQSLTASIIDGTGFVFAGAPMALGYCGCCAELGCGTLDAPVPIVRCHGNHHAS